MPDVRFFVRAQLLTKRLIPNICSSPLSPCREVPIAKTCYLSLLSAKYQTKNYTMRFLVELQSEREGADVGERGSGGVRRTR